MAPDATSAEEYERCIAELEALAPDDADSGRHAAFDEEGRDARGGLAVGLDGAGGEVRGPRVTGPGRGEGV